MEAEGQFNPWCMIGMTRPNADSFLTEVWLADTCDGEIHSMRALIQLHQLWVACENTNLFLLVETAAFWVCNPQGFLLCPDVALGSCSSSTCSDQMIYVLKCMYLNWHSIFHRVHEVPKILADLRKEEYVQWPAKRNSLSASCKYIRYIRGDIQQRPAQGENLHLLRYLLRLSSLLRDLDLRLSLFLSLLLLLECLLRSYLSSPLLPRSPSSWSVISYILRWWWKL
jgi:hypothetical protein